MSDAEKSLPLRALSILVLLHGFASLCHHIHNAAFLEAYPNMPEWLSTAGVYMAWATVASLGLLGYLLIVRGYPCAGLAVVAAYGACGFDGLAHYSLAPISAHTLAMNLTIWLEVLTAAVLVTTAGVLTAKHLSRMRGEAHG